MKKISLVENKFLIIALLFGLCWMFLLPPFQAPDEESHFFRAYGISSGKLICENIGVSNAGSYLPDNINLFQQSLGAEDIKFHYEVKQDLSKFQKAKNMYPSNTESFLAYGNACAYSPIPYIPQVLGIEFGKLFHASWLIIFYLARLINFLAFIGVIYYTIKISPKLKYLILLLALMPMMLHQAVSLSPDALTVSLCFLFVAYVMKMRHESELVSRKNIIVLILLSIAIALLKVTYFPLTFLVFIIPADKFGVRKNFWKTGLSVITLSIVFTGLWFFCTRLSHIEFPLDPTEQLKNALYHPFAFAKLLIMSFFVNDALYIQFFGDFGWLDTPLPLVLAIAYYCVLTIVTFYEGRKEIANPVNERADFWSAILGVVSFVGCALLVEISLYLNWTQDSPNYISGVQGRYFIPIAFAFFYSLYLLIPFIVRKRKSIALIFILLTLLMSCYQLVIRFY
ncbi:DUF2142 domain-containing protein [Paenibacillus polymyxa]|uniref:DUF2142 domain-containing protein n=1 Tax=Paenibacillus polymyxa TaxID=1406 RepID=UPI002AB44A55|nr:DUF2142 domain-containing protein [Paenibacillus polymyxa]MDY7991475.1 DUF2142 domain-containing protein [Paenibacillus polymyxa]MDY8117916.1 DUF2142 domain-containing protein [Paenibacillus polymyxa]